MYAHFVKFFLRTLGWRDLSNETKTLLRSSVQKFDSLLIVYPSTSAWDLLILYAFLSTEISNTNWWLFGEKLPRWFFRVLPAKRKISGSIATAIHYNHKNFCNVYLAPEGSISIEQIPEIAESVAVVGTNYHPNVRKVHVSAQSNKYEVSVDYLPYYLSQFLRVNPGKFPVIAPTYLKRKGITYKPCLRGAMILSVFDPLAVSYLVNCLFAVFLLSGPVCWTSLIVNLWLLYTKYHGSQMFLQSFVVTHLALKFMSGPTELLCFLILACQSLLMLTISDTPFNWGKAEVNARCLASYTLLLTLWVCA
jgi:hypothetical protein